MPLPLTPTNPFSLPHAQFYVTTDVPDDKDLETALEVGSWTWNWMEPQVRCVEGLLMWREGVFTVCLGDNAHV